jgi:hypothetical protein
MYELLLLSIWISSNSMALLKVTNDLLWRPKKATYCFMVCHSCQLFMSEFNKVFFNYEKSSVSCIVTWESWSLIYQNYSLVVSSKRVFTGKNEAVSSNSYGQCAV